MSKEKPCSAACACVENPTENPEAENPPLLKTEEVNGFASKKLPEPTRFGDWEVGGRCSDF